MNPQLLLLLILSGPGLLFLSLSLAWLLGSPFSERAISKLTGYVYCLLSLCVAALGLSLWITPSHAIRANLGFWYSVGDYGFPVEFLADSLSFPLIAATVILVGLVASFSTRYLHRDPGFNRFFLLLNLFAFGALLVFSSASIDLLIAGWELVGITSVLLIAFFQYRPDPVRNGLRVFATYRLADLAILFAVFLAHHWTGSSSWESLFKATHASGASLAPGQIHALAVLLVLAACGKSAQGPFAGWLPRAMEGPTPSSAVFYGAISVHAGAYLLLRAYPLISASIVASCLLFLIGAGTALLSTLVHRTCADAKNSLAYAAQTQLGIIFAEIALGLKTLALLHLCSHAIIRSMQFLRAPSMLRDYHRVHAAAGGHLPPTGEHLEALLPTPFQILLYRVALGRGFYDAIVDRWLVAPTLALAKILARLEPHWIRPHSSPPTTPAASPELTDDTSEVSRVSSP